QRQLPVNLSDSMSIPFVCLRYGLWAMGGGLCIDPSAPVIQEESSCISGEMPRASLTSAPPRAAHVGIQAVDVGLHLLAAPLVDGLASHRAAGVGETVAGRCQVALHAVHPFAQHDRDAVGALVEDHHVDRIAGLGHSQSDFLVHMDYLVR